MMYSSVGLLSNMRAHVTEKYLKNVRIGYIHLLS